MTSDYSFSAEISVTSPRKLFILINSKNVFWIKASKKTIHLILKTEALHVTNLEWMRHLQVFHKDDRLLEPEPVVKMSSSE